MARHDPITMGHGAAMASLHMSPSQVREFNLSEGMSTVAKTLMNAQLDDMSYVPSKIEGSSRLRQFWCIPRLREFHSIPRSCVIYCGVIFGNCLDFHTWSYIKFCGCFILIPSSFQDLNASGYLQTDTCRCVSSPFWLARRKSDAGKGVCRLRTDVLTCVLIFVVCKHRTKEVDTFTLQIPHIRHRNIYIYIMRMLCTTT